MTNNNITYHPWHAEGEVMSRRLVQQNLPVQ